MKKINIRVTFKTHDLEQYRKLETLLKNNKFYNLVLDDNEENTNPKYFILPIGEFYFDIENFNSEKPMMSYILSVLNNSKDFEKVDYSITIKEIRKMRFYNLKMKD